MTKDNFSRQATTYVKFRPVYPQALYDFILGHVSRRKTAWDCGTGNGQAAIALAPHFEKVVASDLSQSQIDNAIRAANVEYCVCQAEETPFADHSFDLVTVAQAVHWFNFEAFYHEVRRVARPGALLALWGYGLLGIDAQTGPLIKEFYTDRIGAYWDAERRHIDREYETIPFPFEQIQAPRFYIEADWTLDMMEGYLNSWSSIQHFIMRNGLNPVDELISQLQLVWQEDEVKRVKFPVFLKMGRV